MRPAVPILILFITLFLTGCLGQDDRKSAEPEIVASLQVSLKEEPKPAPKTETKADRKAEIEKWNSYVDLANDIEAGFNPALNKYFEAFSNRPTYQPAGGGALVRDFTAALTSPEDLEATIDQALLMAAREPKSDLDQAVGELAGHLKELWGYLGQARTFHEAAPEAALPGDSSPPPAAASLSGDLASAAPEGAQALHAQIYDAYQNFSVAYGRFRDGLNKADAERRKKDIQEMGGQGLVIRPAMLTLVDQTQALQDMLSSRNITSETLPALDMDRFGALFDEFVKNADAFERTLADPEQPVREKLNLQALGGFDQQLMVVRASATILMARHRLKTKAEPFPNETPGTPEHFGRVVGDLVDLYNETID